jgi:hypothetical protein
VADAPVVELLEEADVDTVEVASPRVEVIVVGTVAEDEAMLHTESVSRRLMEKTLIWSRLVHGEGTGILHHTAIS